MSFEQGLSSPLVKAESITPHDSNEITTGCRALYVGTAGDVSVILKGDTSAVLLKNLAAGVWHPMQVKVVQATGLTAADVVAGY